MHIIFAVFTLSGHGFTFTFKNTACVRVSSAFVLKTQKRFVRIDKQHFYFDIKPNNPNPTQHVTEHGDVNKILTIIKK